MKNLTQVNENWLNKPSAICSGIFGAILGFCFGWFLAIVWMALTGILMMPAPLYEEKKGAISFTANIIVGLNTVLIGLAGFGLGRRKRRDLHEMRHAALEDDDPLNKFQPSPSEANESIRRIDGEINPSGIPRGPAWV